MKRAAPDGPALFDLPMSRETPRRPAEPQAGEPGETLPLFDDEEPAAATAGELDEAPPPEVRGAGREGEAPAPTSGAVTAPLGARFAGGLTDVGVHLAVAALLAGGTVAMGAPLDRAALPAMGAVLAVFSFLYHVVPLAFWGRTPGMAARRLVARSREGGPLTFGQTGIRWLAALLTTALAGLPLLLALTGRSLSDRLSGSVTRLRSS